ncbi:MAG: MltA-interacting MipA family protein, partial [Phycisphaerae bacterium]
MKKFIAMAAACYLMTACVPVFAGDDFAFNLTSDFYSKYVWRGQLLNDDPVFQPSIGIGYK